MYFLTDNKVRGYFGIGQFIKGLTMFRKSGRQFRSVCMTGILAVENRKIGMMVMMNKKMSQYDQASKSNK